MYLYLCWVKMDTEKDVLENKAKIRMLELKIEVLTKLLNKEGIVLEEELETEFSKLVKENQNGS